MLVQVGLCQTCSETTLLVFHEAAHLPLDQVLLLPIVLVNSVEADITEKFIHLDGKPQQNQTFM